MISKLFIVFTGIGILLLGSSYIFHGILDLLVFSGFVLLFLGLVVSFAAMFRKEQGKMKFLAVGAFFLFSFVVTWIDSFQILRLFTWIKN
ncbi:hypothetical protein [Neobacillus dielmonensis]|uniref:hypothetical protein n=1 Tax=Neobacillus dielmonensis TaxID=1347369 RepID=UPI000693645B|nr:hypothetical protein [Neobacillus dielmonensis]